MSANGATINRIGYLKIAGINKLLKQARRAAHAGNEDAEIAIREMALLRLDKIKKEQLTGLYGAKVRGAEISERLGGAPGSYLARGNAYYNAAVRRGQAYGIASELQMSSARKQLLFCVNDLTDAVRQYEHQSSLEARILPAAEWVSLILTEHKGLFPEAEQVRLNAWVEARRVRFMLMT